MKVRNTIALAAVVAVLGFIAQGNSISANAVNDYIFGKNYTPQKSQNNIQQWLNNPNWEGVNMNYRHGRPEGVLVHETANSSDKYDSNAIWNEINYMLNHADSAFVHSFVNSSTAIEIANPSYLAWGAGAAGNARFIQTEQVQVEGKDAFAHELFNLAVLQATYLKTYDLKPSLGGTVWSHSMVSQKLGGTNHTDPDGYWADMAARYFGSTYTMNDYQALISKVYNNMFNQHAQITSSKDVDYVVTMKASGNTGVDADQPYQVEGSQHVGLASQYNGKLLHVVKEVKQSWNPDVVWLGFNLDGRTIYVESGAVVKGAQVASEKKVNYKAHINGLNNNVGIDANQPYQVQGSTHYGYAKDYNGQQVTVEAEVTTNHPATWVKFKLNGKTVYTEKSAVSQNDYVTKYTKVNYNALIDGYKHSGSGIDSVNPWRVDGSERFGYSQQYTGQKVQVVAELRTKYDDVTWAEIVMNGKHLYVDKSVLSKSESVITGAKNVNYVTGIDGWESASGIDANQPWHTDGSSHFGYAKDYNGQKITVTKEVTTSNGATWVEFKLGGKTVYMDKNATTNGAVITAAKNLKYNAVINGLGSTQGIDADKPYNVKGSSHFGFASSFAGQTVSVVCEVTTSDNVVWAEFKLNGKTLYIDKRTLSDKPVVTERKTVNYQAVIRASDSGIDANQPWHVAGSVHFGSARQYDGTLINATAEVKTSDVNATWVEFKMAGKTLYIEKGTLDFGKATITGSKTVNYQAKLATAGSNEGLDTVQPYNVLGSKHYGWARDYDGKTINVTREVTTTDNVTWLEFTLNGQKVFVNSAVVKRGAQITNSRVVNYQGVMNSKNSGEGIDAVQPYNVLGSVHYGWARDYDGKTINVTREVTTTDNVTWLEFTLNGQNVFVNSSVVKRGAQITNSKVVNYQGVINSKNSGEGIDANQPYNVLGSVHYGWARDYDGKTINVTREVTTTDNVVWIEFKINNQVVYVNSSVVARR